MNEWMSLEDMKSAAATGAGLTMYMEEEEV